MLSNGPFLLCLSLFFDIQFSTMECYLLYPPFFNIRNPRYLRNTLFLFSIHVHLDSCTFGSFVPQIPSFSIWLKVKFSWTGIPFSFLLIPYLWYLLFFSLLMILCYTILQHLSTHFSIFFIIFYYFSIFRQIITHFAPFKVTGTCLLTHRIPAKLGAEAWQYPSGTLALWVQRSGTKVSQ